MAGIFLVPKLRWWKRLLLLLAIGLGTVALVITFSRGNWVALFVGVVVLLFLAGKLRYLFYVTIAFCVAIVVVKNYVPFAEYIFERFYSIFSLFVEFGADSRASSTARVYFAIAGFKMFLEHPLLGVGWRAFPVIFQDYKPEGFPHWLPTRESHTLFATIHRGTRDRGAASRYLDCLAHLGFCLLPHKAHAGRVFAQCDDRARRDFRRLPSQPHLHRRVCQQFLVDVHGSHVCRASLRRTRGT